MNLFLFILLPLALCIPNWSIFIYMDADNNLESSGIEDLEEIKALSHFVKSGVLEVIVFIDRLQSKYNDSTPLLINGQMVHFSNSKILRLSDDPSIGFHFIKDADEDSLTIESLSSFLSELVPLYPAKRKFLEFWDHGAAAFGFGSDDSHEEKTMKIIDVSQAISISKFKFDVIGFDACLMSSYEAISTLSSHADYYIASEDVAPGDGWDYTTFDPLQTDPVKFCESIMKGFSGVVGATGFQTNTIFYLPKFIEFDKHMIHLAGELRDAVTHDNLAAITALPRARSAVREISPSTMIVDLRSLLLHLEAVLSRCPVAEYITKTIKKLDESIIKFEANRPTTLKGINIFCNKITESNTLFKYYSTQTSEKGTGFFAWKTLLEDIEEKRNSKTIPTGTDWCPQGSSSTYGAQFPLPDQEGRAEASLASGFSMSKAGVSFRQGMLHRSYTVHAKVHPSAADVKGRIVLKMDHEVLNNHHAVGLQENDYVVIAKYKSNVSVIGDSHWAHIDMNEPVVGLFQFAIPPRTSLVTPYWIEHDHAIILVKYYEEGDEIPRNDKGIPTGEKGYLAELHAQWVGMHYRLALYLVNPRQEIRPKVNPGWIVPLYTVYRDNKEMLMGGWQEFHWRGRMRNVKLVPVTDKLLMFSTSASAVKKVVVTMHVTGVNLDSCVLYTTFSYPERVKEEELVECYEHETPKEPEKEKHDEL